MASSQKEILAFIDIPKFSNDLRLLILDYMYIRAVTKLKDDLGHYYLHLNTGLIDNKLCLQITVSNDTLNYVISTFGTYCEEKAIREYDCLKMCISNISITHWGQVFIDESSSFWPKSARYYRYSSCPTGSDRSDTVIYRRYAFCPADGSTTMIQLRVNDSDWNNYWRIRLYFIKDVEISRDDKHVRIDLNWKALLVHVPIVFPGDEERKQETINYQNLAVQHGQRVNNYKNLRLRPTYENFSESIWLSLFESS